MTKALPTNAKRKAHCGRARRRPIEKVDAILNLLPANSE